MAETHAAEETESAVFVQRYLDAFGDRDVARCLAFFADDATLHFAAGVYRGKQAIADWRTDRRAGLTVPTSKPTVRSPGV